MVGSGSQGSSLAGQEGRDWPDRGRERWPKSPLAMTLQPVIPGENSFPSSREHSMACGSVSSADTFGELSHIGEPRNPDPREIDPGIEAGHVKDSLALILAQHRSAATDPSLV